MYILCPYDCIKKTVSGMFLTMCVEDELRGNFVGGRVLKVNSKEYVLGPRTFDKKSRSVMYELILHVAVVSLPVED